MRARVNRSTTTQAGRPLTVRLRDAWVAAFLLLVNGVAFNASPARAQATRIDPLTDAPPALQRAISRNESIAARMFKQDHAAAIAHDELVKRDVLGKDESLRGWITDDRESGVTVLFVGERGGDTVGLYKVVTEAGSIPADGYAVLQPPLALSESQRAQFRARLLASGADVPRCVATYNTVVLPAYDRVDGSLHVYLIAATSVPRRIIFGGHHRFTISRDGNTIEDRRAFTKGCFDMDTRAPGAAVVSHLLDPNPTEMHVFLNLLSGTRIGVVTMENTIIWFVEGGRVTGFRHLTGEPGETRGPNY